MANNVIIDNWTLHNSAHVICFPDRAEDKYQDFENLLMAILLWDEIYYWDNDNGTKWNYIFEDREVEIPIKKVAISQQVLNEVAAIEDKDIIRGGALQYQMIANEMGLDYLVEKKRCNYIHKPNDIRDVLLPQKFVYHIEKDVEEYYKSLMKFFDNKELKFRFPLLVDYILKEAGSIKQCINVAMDMRETRELKNMRKWIANLHKDINNGNWLKVEKAIKDVDDIISDIICSHTIYSEVQIRIPLSINICFALKKFGKHKIQLTFLRNLANFAIKARPER